MNRSVPQSRMAALNATVVWLISDWSDWQLPGAAIVAIVCLQSVQLHTTPRLIAPSWSFTSVLPPNWLQLLLGNLINPIDNVIFYVRAIKGY